MFSKTMLRSLPVLTTSLSLFTRSRCDAKQDKNRRLIDIIPPIKSNRKGDFVHEKSCLSWAQESTGDYQKLQYTPTNFLRTIAFLQLLGAERISLSQISYNILTRNVFINQLPQLPTPREPIIIFSVPQAFLAVRECQMHSDNKPRLRKHLINNAIVHMLPALVQQALVEFEQGKITELYETVAYLSDDDIREFVDNFISDDNEALRTDLLQRLKIAREACLRYCHEPQSPQLK